MPPGACVEQPSWTGWIYVECVVKQYPSNIDFYRKYKIDKYHIINVNRIGMAYLPLL